MPSRSCTIVLSVFGLATAAIVLSAVAWAKASDLSLPIPLALPALNVLLPILTALATPLSRRFATSVKKHALRLALPYMAYFSTLAPFTLFILSLVYALPSDLRACAADRQWLRMFDNKNERSVRTIQTRLQCCGYNSMHDRAWPFPSRNVDVRTCERTMGYTVACGEMWRHWEVFVAALTAAASFLNCLMTVRRLGNKCPAARLTRCRY